MENQGRRSYDYYTCAGACRLFSSLKLRGRGRARVKILIQALIQDFSQGEGRDLLGTKLFSAIRNKTQEKGTKLT